MKKLIPNLMNLKYWEIMWGNACVHFLLRTKHNLSLNCGLAPRVAPGGQTAKSQCGEHVIISKANVSKDWDTASYPQTLWQFKIRHSIVFSNFPEAKSRRILEQYAPITKPCQDLPTVCNKPTITPLSIIKNITGVYRLSEIFADSKI